jgi:hypothetical protein
MRLFRQVSHAAVAELARVPTGRQRNSGEFRYRRLTGRQRNSGEFRYGRLQRAINLNYSPGGFCFTAT